MAEKPSRKAYDHLVRGGPTPLAALAQRARHARTGSAMLQGALQHLPEAGATWKDRYEIWRKQRLGRSASL